MMNFHASGKCILTIVGLKIIMIPMMNGMVGGERKGLQKASIGRIMKDLGIWEALRTALASGDS